MHARYQGWNIARFLSPDVAVKRGPLQDPQGWNRYTYGGNSPLTLVDPDGLAPVLPKDVLRAMNTLNSASKDLFEQALSDLRAGDYGGSVKNFAAGAISSLGAFVADPANVYLFGPGGMALRVPGKVASGLLKGVSNPKLRNIVSDLYQDSDKVLGGTAGALRHEKLTGELVGGKPHLQKAGYLAQGLRKLIHGGTLTGKERALAVQELKKLDAALKLQ